MHRSLLSAAVALTLATAPALHASAAPTRASAGTAAGDTTTQLPRTAVPTHYQISLAPDAATATFSGRAVVTINVTKPTSALTLNAADLTFAKVTLTPAAGGAGRDATVNIDAEAQTATFTFAQPVAPGLYHLAMDYSGVIGTQAVGLFSLDYPGADGKKQRALYTQFENSDARRMIPSWDEPAYKASFALDVVVPAGQMAVSNMPAAHTEALPDGRRRVSFATTPKMSTYLLFLALGDFERATAKVDGTEVGVVTRRGALPQARFALDAQQAILREYNDYFGVRYPLPKLDNVAGAGRSQFFSAMENWGAIFTFEYALLLDPTIATQHDREEIFSTAAHEMAHQWFGDLVTMRWWDDLWLNEGFASWMESRMTARLHPEWNTRLGTVATRETAMRRDSVAGTHPVVQHVETVEQANQAFDEITYSKGESVIRMLEAYVGENAWRSGVRAYMKANAYGNTVSDDLWKQIEKAAGKPVTAIAHDFTLQPGIPLIKVGDPACSNGAATVPLTQAEFTRDRAGKAPLAWRVPVIAQIAGNAKQGTTLVAGGQGAVTVPGCGAVIVNAGQTGYFRTLYTTAGFAQLTQQFAGIAPIDQIGLLADSSALGLAGLQPASDVLDLVQATPAGADPAVWSRIAGLLDGIHERYRAEARGGDTTRQRRFAAYATSRLAPLMAQVGWTARPDEPTAVANLRERLIVVLSDLGDATTVAEARRRYAALAQDPQAVPGPLRKTVMGVVAQHADAAMWDQLHAAARNETSPLVRDQRYTLLAATEDRALAMRALELALTDEPGLTISATMISEVAMRYPDMAFDFAVAHLAKINERVDASSRSRYLARLAMGSADPAMVNKLGAYADANLAPTSRGDVEAAVAAIQDRIRVNAARVPEIDAWLAKNAR
ncbi:M1 family metallopeptidase [Massilia sp. TW-1]|uniref:Aminopeptidase n=1 Tax=Telluria antibiotica TaxID=2717319 RepID=A0ABX0PF26_9BURK|nr:M1 family metallopeptidase [Telluria antibiotica]NIA55214.1 M1 family metallopeptidase [Telluria antibiotica]